MDQLFNRKYLPLNLGIILGGMASLITFGPANSFFGRVEGLLSSSVWSIIVDLLLCLTSFKIARWAGKRISMMYIESVFERGKRWSTFMTAWLFGVVMSCCYIFMVVSVAGTLSSVLELVMRKQLGL